MEVEEDNAAKPEDDEEEILVYVDFESYLLSSEFEQPNLSFGIIGVDAENPIIEINGKFFKGTYDYAIGTQLFFEEDNDPPSVDPLYDPNPSKFFKLAAKTNKILKMERLFIEKQKATDEPEISQLIKDLIETKEPNMRYGDALKLILAKNHEAPRVIPPEDFPPIADAQINEVNDNIDKT